MDKSEKLADGKPVLSFDMQMKVANIMCKLITTPTFDHLMPKMETEDVKKATGGWAPGCKATKQLGEWCQDQWRRKQPVLPKSKVQKSYLCTPLFSESLPLCYSCGTPCPECCEELGHGLPPELQTAIAIKDYEQIHEHAQSKETEEYQDNEEEQMEIESVPRMRLRSRPR